MREGDSDRSVGSVRRVLVVIHPTTFGGLHNMVSLLHRPLRGYGFETWALVPEGLDHVRDRMASGGAPIIERPLHRVRRSLSPRVQIDMVRTFRSEVADIVDIILRNQISILQTHGIMNRHAFVAARRARVPLVLQLNSDYAPTVAKAMARPAFARADAVMYEGSGVLRAFSGLRRAKGTFSFLPPVAVESVRRDAVAREAVRRELGLPDDAILFGAVGNFSRQKGHDRLLQAAIRIAKQDKDAHFLLVGRAVPSNAKFHQREVLDLARNSAELRGRVTFMSPDGPVLDILSALDVYVVASRGEGVATSTLEAMCVGLPVVAFDVGSLRDVVTDGQTGYLVDDGDIEGLAARCLELGTADADRSRMGAAGRHRALQDFALERSASVHAKAYSFAMDTFRSRMVGGRVRRAAWFLLGRGQRGGIGEVGAP